MSGRVQVLIGPIGQDSIDVTGDTVAGILRQVIVGHPEFAETMNDKSADLLIGRFRRVFLNDEVIWGFGCGARWDDAQPNSPHYPQLPGVYRGLNIPVHDGDIIHVIQCLCC